MDGKKFQNCGRDFIEETRISSRGRAIVLFFIERRSIMAVVLRQNLVSRGKYNIKCPYSMKAESITVHNTWNDASAENEVKYMIGNNKKVSFHIAVDDKEAVQGIPLDRNAWHAGDGNGKGNRSSIGVEICHSKSGGERFAKAERNAAELIAGMLKERGWGIDRVKKHQDWSGKYCPHRTLDLGWERFLNMIRGYLGQATVPVKPQAPSKPSKPSKPTSNKINVDGSWGQATTKALQKILGTKQDGIVSNQPTINRKYLYSASSTSWQFKKTGYSAGSNMIRALQKLIGAKVDGWFGKNSVITLQRFLKVKADGSMGPATVRALQKYINSRL